MAAPKPVVMIAIPAHSGQVTTDFMRSLIQLIRLADAEGIGTRMLTITKEALISRARNAFAAKFMATPECTHLLFLDADIGFCPDGVMRMLALDKSVIGSAYPKKQLNWTRIAKAARQGVADQDLLARGVEFALNLEHSESDQIDIADGAIEVKSIGTGVMLIQRFVIENMRSFYPELRYRSDIEAYGLHGDFYGLFDTMVDPGTGAFLAEDYAFCHRWRGAGGEVFADVISENTHVGNFKYTGRLFDIG